MKKIKNYLPPIALFAFLILAWEVYVRSGSIKQSILPSPSLVVNSLYDFKAVILGHTLQTAAETLIGFVLAIGLGLAAASTIFFSKMARKAVYPLLVISQTIPMIALAPLLLIWFGFGILPKIIIVMLYCFFPIAVATADGLINTPKHLEDYMKTLGASRIQIFRRVNFPFALDGLFSGLKISSVYAVTGAVIGEYVGAFKGLGIYLQTSASSHATALVFAAILVIVFLSLSLLVLVILMQKLLMPWKRANEPKI